MPVKVSPFDSAATFNRPDEAFWFSKQQNFAFIFPFMLCNPW